MYTIFDGTVTAGYQFASGNAVNRQLKPSPYSKGTLEIQSHNFKEAGFDLETSIPNLYWGTVNVKLSEQLSLERPDLTLPNIDWTSGETASGRIPPETFSFIRCCLAYRGIFHLGYIYYPHPETKPSNNAHHYDVLEVLTEHVDELAYGESVSVICRADAFAPYP